MTDDAGQGRRSFPYLPDRNYWAIRQRFQQSPPRGDVDAEYLAGILDITVPAARNLTGPLRALGLVGEDGRLTDRAMQWRDDEHYRDVTSEIIEEVYPQGLRDIAPPPAPDRTTVERWFMRSTGTGQAAASRMARLYILLASGDPNPVQTADRTAPRSEPQARSAGARRRRQTTSTTAQQPAQPQPTAPPSASGASQRQDGPSVHIDIQVHIDPAATAEQIDQIFASMARHLYGRD